MSNHNRFAKRHYFQLLSLFQQRQINLYPRRCRIIRCRHHMPKNWSHDRYSPKRRYRACRDKYKVPTLWVCAHGKSVPDNSEANKSHSSITALRLGRRTLHLNPRLTQKRLLAQYRPLSYKGP